MSKSRHYFSVALAVVILASPFLVWGKQQAIADWWKLRGYTPPTTVVSLANSDTMTAEARHVLYVNHPQLVTDSANFRQDCTVSEQTIVLGCYHSSQDGIYIFSVKDARLSGVEQVTIAHEMLHAAYDRLSSSERERIDGLLNDYFTHNLHDQRILDTINSYKKTEPKDITNEMHSVFGTEISNLPKSLENYYNQYFTQRSAVVSFALSYENEFTSRITQINSYDVQLSRLKSQITAEKQGLDELLNQLNSDRARLDSLRSSGQSAEYNAAVPGFNSEIATYNGGVESYNSDIASYNSVINIRNSIAKDLRSLDNAIDTRLTTQSAQ
jgi:hypothetical protein